MGEREQRGPKITRSLQVRLALGYGVIIAALLLLMNTYPLLAVQNQMFRAQQTDLQSQLSLVCNSLTTADELTGETVEGAVRRLEDDLDVGRLLITDEAGLVLYDTGEDALTGKYALTGEIVAALRGSDAFSSDYDSGVFLSRGACPIMTRNTVVGAVCLYDQDTAQGAVLQELQQNLRLISVVVCLAVLGLFWAFSHVLTRRVGQLLAGIRMVREGEYTQRISLSGHDELAQLAQELNLLTGRLQTTEAERRRFVSDASHELKTPLASIKLLTDSILQDEHIDQATTRDFVQDIGEAADRLICVSQDLLELNRLDEGRKVRREPVDLSEQAEYTAKLLTPLAETAGVGIHLHLERGCMALCGREDAIQILRNLMENAIKYNNPGGRVDVTTSCSGNTVGLEVADTGVGIPAEDMPRIFERFYRVDKARSREAGGTGLGLSIVKDTVLLHGGEVMVEPRETEGTRFLVRLPRWDGEEGDS